ncbi:MAG: hypothetical protein JO338_07015 [Aquitalea sp.]|nr:hypothetical protein [Aquitalea sp.]
MGLQNKNSLQIAQGEVQIAILLAKEIAGLVASATEKSKLQLMETILRDIYQQLDDAQHERNVIKGNERISLI